MAESNREMLDRVRMMASGDATWDLSENDCRALVYVLSEMAELRKDTARLDWIIRNEWLDDDVLNEMRFCADHSPKEARSFIDAAMDKARLDWSEAMAAAYPELERDGLVPMTRPAIDAAMEKRG